jgi:acetolactate synthase I/III small subunit
MAPTPAGGVARRTLSVLVEDVPGVLAKVAGLFARRAFNIHSLAVGPSEISGLSRITVVVDADAKLLEQITKQLNKLINVIKIIELEPTNSVQREHLVIKVKADAAARLQVTQAVELFRAKIVDVSTDSLTVEATGAADKLDALLSVLEPFGVREIVRSGSLAISRGSKSMTEKISAEKSFK